MTVPQPHLACQIDFPFCMRRNFCIESRPNCWPRSSAFLGAKQPQAFTEPVLRLLLLTLVLPPQSQEHIQMPQRFAGSGPTTVR
jgi:hypothetical protein